MQPAGREDDEVTKAREMGRGGVTIRMRDWRGEGVEGVVRLPWVQRACTPSRSSKPFFTESASENERAWHERENWG